MGLAARGRGRSGHGKPPGPRARSDCALASLRLSMRVLVFYSSVAKRHLLVAQVRARGSVLTPLPPVGKAWRPLGGHGRRLNTGLGVHGESRVYLSGKVVKVKFSAPSFRMAMPFYALPCHAMPCHAMPCHALLCSAWGRCCAMPCLRVCSVGQCRGPSQGGPAPPSGAPGPGRSSTLIWCCSAAAAAELASPCVI